MHTRKQDENSKSCCILSGVHYFSFCFFVFFGVVCWYLLSTKPAWSKTKHRKTVTKHTHIHKLREREAEADRKRDKATTITNVTRGSNTKMNNVNTPSVQSFNCYHVLSAAHACLRVCVCASVCLSCTYSQDVSIYGWLSSALRIRHIAIQLGACLRLLCAKGGRVGAG